MTNYIFIAHYSFANDNDNVKLAQRQQAMWEYESIWNTTIYLIN